MCLMTEIVVCLSNGNHFPEVSDYQPSQLDLLEVPVEPLGMHKAGSCSNVNTPFNRRDTSQSLSPLSIRSHSASKLLQPMHSHDEIDRQKGATSQQLSSDANYTRQKSELALTSRNNRIDSTTND